MHKNVILSLFVMDQPIASSCLSAAVVAALTMFGCSSTKSEPPEHVAKTSQALCSDCLTDCWEIDCDYGMTDPCRQPDYANCQATCNGYWGGTGCTHEQHCVGDTIYVLTTCYDNCSGAVVSQTDTPATAGTGQNGIDCSTLPGGPSCTASGGQCSNSSECCNGACGCNGPCDPNGYGQCN
jgi:hypothetical protein